VTKALQEQSLFVVENFVHASLRLYLGITIKYKTFYRTSLMPVDRTIRGAKQGLSHIRLRVRVPNNTRARAVYPDYITIDEYFRLSWLAGSCGHWIASWYKISPCKFVQKCPFVK
jgi:hypothetical protein